MKETVINLKRTKQNIKAKMKLIQILNDNFKMTK